MLKLNQPQIFKYLLLLAISVALTGATLVLGAIPMRVIRKAYSRKAYWVGMASAALLSFIFLSHAAAIAIALLASLVGLYTDAEEAGSGIFAAGFFASLTTSSFALVAAAFWATKKKIDLVQVANANVDQVLAQVKSINPQLNWTTESLVYQVPSAFVIFLLASLAAALVWDGRLGTALKVNVWEPNTRSLRGFRAPDILIWLSLVVIAGAFGQQKFIPLQNICVNVVNVLALIYFFQGLAIAKHFFGLYRVSKLWQSVAFFFMLLQLFPLASLMGFTDYWINYRTRFTKQRQGESPFKSEN